MTGPAALPYRPNVGIALFNADGLVLIAHRIGDDGPEIILAGHDWQMPQGGVDPNEDPDEAARRELWEETGVTSVRILGRTAAPMRYDFPAHRGPANKLSRYRGQEQTWYAMRFLGRESEIDLDAHRDGKPEFDGWRWEALDRVPSLVVPFKRTIYDAVAAEFRPFAQPVLTLGSAPSKD